MATQAFTESRLFGMEESPAFARIARVPKPVGVDVTNIFIARHPRWGWNVNPDAPWLDNRAWTRMTVQAISPTEAGELIEWVVDKRTGVVTEVRREALGSGSAPGEPNTATHNENIIFDPLNPGTVQWAIITDLAEEFTEAEVRGICDELMALHAGGAPFTSTDFLDNTFTNFEENPNPGFPWDTTGHPSANGFIAAYPFGESSPVVYSWRQWHSGQTISVNADQFEPRPTITLPGIGVWSNPFHGIQDRSDSWIAYNNNRAAHACWDPYFERWIPLFMLVGDLTFRPGFSVGGAFLAGSFPHPFNRTSGLLMRSQIRQPRYTDPGVELIRIETPVTPETLGRGSEGDKFTHPGPFSAFTALPGSSVVNVPAPDEPSLITISRNIPGRPIQFPST